MKLQQILNQMYQDALAHSYLPQKRKLKNGLLISLTCHSSGCTLKLSRDTTFPSAQEWDTVIKNFPYYSNAQFVKTTDTDQRLALIGELPSRKQIAEQQMLDLGNHG